jgi:hypothetical protein
VEDLERGGDSRRDVLRKMAYVAPVVASFAAAPAFARSGSAGAGTSDRAERTSHESGRTQRQVRNQR